MTKRWMRMSAVGTVTAVLAVVLLCGSPGGGGGSSAEPSGAPTTAEGCPGRLIDVRHLWHDWENLLGHLELYRVNEHDPDEETVCAIARADNEPWAADVRSMQLLIQRCASTVPYVVCEPDVGIAEATQEHVVASTNTGPLSVRVLGHCVAASVTVEFIGGRTRSANLPHRLGDGTLAAGYCR